MVYDTVTDSSIEYLTDKVPLPIQQIQENSCRQPFPICKINLILKLFVGHHFSHWDQILLIFYVHQ